MRRVRLHFAITMYNTPEFETVLPPAANSCPDFELMDYSTAVSLLQAEVLCSYHSHLAAEFREGVFS